jgi:hypothetical protein
MKHVRSARSRIGLVFRSFSPAAAGMVLMGLVGIGSASAQRATIIINEPVEWREQPFKPLRITDGRSVRIAGSVTHPSSVDRVLVNGKAALLVPDASTTDTWDFEVFLPPDSIGREVTIVIVPKTSQRVETRFPGTALNDTTHIPNGGGTRNPWGGFRKRGALYGVLAAGGAYLAVKTTSESSVFCETVGGLQDCFERTENKAESRTIGLGLVGAAVAGLVIDGIITSGKAGGGSGINDSNGFDFNALNLAPTSRGSRLDVFRLQYFIR